MGIEVLAKTPEEWVTICREAVKADFARQQIVRSRVRLYFDDYRELLTNLIQNSTTDPKVVEQLLPFVPMVGGSNLIKRVANELGRPHYANDALRRIHVGDEPNEAAQEAWDALATEMEINRVMGQVMRLIIPSGRVYLKVRVVSDDAESAGAMVLDLFTRDMMTVIPNHKRPTKGMVYIHCCKMMNGEPYEYVAIDNKRAFTFTMGGDPAPTGIEPHDWGVIPVVDICKDERPGQYDNITDGDDLKSQTLDSMAIGLLLKAKAFQQSHIQLAFKGDLDGIPQSQTLHNKSIIFIGGGPDNQLFPIDLQSSPDGLLKMQEQGENTVAGNYGISRDRLNQKGGGDDDGLQERVAELAQVAYSAEQGIFAVAKPVSREHPKHTLPKDAWMIVDLGNLHNRGDRKTILENRAEEKRQGLKSTYDHVLAENPEYGADRMLAKAHVVRVAAENAEADELLKANNTPRDANTDEPGQTAAANGAMGPMVRDGKMSKDAAAKKATGSKGEGAKAYRRMVANGAN